MKTQAPARVSPGYNSLIESLKPIEEAYLKMFLILRKIESLGKEVIFAMDLISHMIKLLGKYQGNELVESLYFRIPEEIEKTTKKYHSSLVAVYTVCRDYCGRN